jgi:hypothetical protein
MDGDCTQINSHASVQVNCERMLSACKDAPMQVASSVFVKVDLETLTLNVNPEMLEPKTDIATGNLTRKLKRALRRDTGADFAVSVLFS